MINYSKANCKGCDEYDYIYKKGYCKRCYDEITATN